MKPGLATSTWASAPPRGMRGTRRSAISSGGICMTLASFSGMLVA